MAERESISINIQMSVRGYQTLQYNRSQNDGEMSFDEYLEKMALLGSFVSRIQDEHDGIVLFENFEGEKTLIDEKIAEELSSMPRNISYFPPQQS